VLPNVPAFVGLHLYTQAWASAPGQNAAGVITSNGLSMFVGSS
jgi:hypothetical protein